ncbi:Signal transduction histidine kinase [Belnapia rosea]|uniref:Sensory/regulatory protein RpfC n=2 Tax=Belnapia rosea TaxID=938405 RepID=A0A1G6YCB8_9PROT|nr:Signal transduction histidine kinase [Belnapia rosea]
MRRIGRPIGGMPDHAHREEWIEPAEAALLLPALLRQMTAGLALLDADLTLRLANPALAGVLQLGASPARGQPLAALLEPAAGPALAEALAPFLAPAGGTTHWTAADGRQIEVVVEVLADGGRLGIWRDVTRQREAEADLAETRTRTELLLRHITDSIVLMDPDGVILENSDRSGRLLDLPPELVQPGRTHQEVLRYMYRRGDYGFEEPEEEFIARRRAEVLAAGDLTFATLMPSGVWAEYNFRPRPDGHLLINIRDVTALKEAQATLEAERAQARRLLANLTDAVMLFDADGTLLETNGHEARVLDLPVEYCLPGARFQDGLRHMVRRGDFGLDRPEDAEVAAHWLALTSPGHKRLVRRIASGRWIELHYHPQPDGKLFIVARDITEMREGELALEAEQATLRTVIDNLSDGVMLFDRDFRWRIANRQLMEFLRLPPEIAFPGADGRDLLRFQARRGDFGPPPEDEATLEAVVEERARQMLQPGGNRFVRRTAGGYWIEFNMLPLPDGGLLACIRDITRLKDQEEALEAERALLRRVLDGMQDAVILLDPDGAIVETNGKAPALFGLPEELMQRGSSHQAVQRWRYRNGEYGFDRPEDEVVEERWATVRSVEGAMPLRLMPNGKWVENQFRTLPNGQILATCRDMTALKLGEQAALAAKAEAEAARDAAEAAARAKATFLAAMSHEIRTPMNGVLGMMEILERSGLSQEQARSIAVMRDSAQSLLRIIDDILDFSKIDAGRLEVEALPFSLRGLVEGTVETLAPQARAKGLALFTDPPGPGPDWVAGDPTRVRQILFNLIGNALKFTERGFVRVMTDTRPLPEGMVQVVLAVEDSGIGFDAAARARLFQPFAQADSSTTRRFGGTGLGLSIVRRLAQLMGGDVAVESTPGRGSRFTVTLRLGPATEGDAAAPAAAAAPPATPQALEGLPKLLVADDHPVNREVMLRQLEVLGLSADVAEDGAEALRLWRARRHGILLLDLHMPELDGFGLARAIREEEAAQGLARSGLVAVTADALKGEDVRCYAAGMDGFLSKPVSLDALARTLGRWLPELAPEVATADTVAGALFDPEALRGLFGADAARLSGILDSFAANASQEVATLAAAAEAQRIAGTAHRLKGASHLVGARLLAEQAARVESLARDGDAAAARQAAAGIDALLARTLRAARQSTGAGAGA